MVIDDGSTDNTRAVVESHDVNILSHQINRGIGAAIRTGIEFARQKSYKAVVIFSGSGKMKAADLKHVISPIIEGSADYVTGSRFLPGGSSPGLTPFRCLAIPVFSFLVSPFLGRWFSDITCGFRSYCIDFLYREPVDITQSWLDKYELEYYIHYWAAKLKLRIKEVPVCIPYDHLPPSRVSKIKPFIGWWSMIRPFVFLALKLKK